MRTERLEVTGMICGDCINNITRALKAVPGIRDMKVTLSTGEVEIQFDE